MPKIQVIILNELGLHARTATRLVECANHFECKVWLSHENRRVDGKSIMGLLTLAAGPGMKLEIETLGSDANLALVALSDLIASGFAETGA